MNPVIRLLTRHDRTAEARAAYETSVAGRSETAETVRLLREAAERLTATTVEVRTETARFRRSHPEAPPVTVRERLGNEDVTCSWGHQSCIDPADWLLWDDEGSEAACNRHLAAMVSYVTGGRYDRYGDLP